MVCPIIMLQTICLLTIFGSVLGLGTEKPCFPEKTDYGYVCRCDENYCDNLKVPLPQNDNSFVLITSSDSQRFSYIKGKLNNRRNRCNFDPVQLNVGRQTSPREIVGFGGAFTGSVSYILSRFTPALRKYFYENCYSKESGLGYSMMRIPIGGSDFDLEKWVYNLYPEYDERLPDFYELDPRDKLRNEQIKELKEITRNGDIKTFAAAWYSPPWMRAKNKWSGSADNQILSQYYQAWADYHVRWLNYMRKDGILIWGLSPGNEPSYMRLYPNIPMLSWNGTDQGKWLVEHLIPALQFNGHHDIKILGVDDMRNVTLEWLEQMREGNPLALHFIDYVAVHPYFDSMTSPRILDDVYRLHNKPIIYTEMSFAVMDTPKILPGSWPRAEEFIKIILDSLEHDISGYVDWNLMLNSTGGPKYDDGRGLDACILATEDFSGFIKEPLYYAMAHFSKYIIPGSRKIRTNISEAQSPFIRSVAYLRPDRLISVILYNNHTKNSIDLNVDDFVQGSSTYTLEPKSLNTLLYSADGIGISNKINNLNSFNPFDNFAGAQIQVSV